MTAKEAIKARCKDCHEVPFKCEETTCPLHGLSKPKRGANRTKAITDYCKWCMNGLSVGGCVCKNCSIYQYRGLTGAEDA